MVEQRPEGTSNEVSGPVAAVVQAGTVHGGITVHRSGDGGPASLRQLPMAPAKFVNREAQLASLDALVAGRPAEGVGTVVLTAVAGAPGIGKTSLALHWAHRVRHRFPDGDLYLNLRGYGAAPPLTAFQGVEFFLHALGVPAERVPADLDSAAALYRSLLDGKRVLILIDNAVSAAQTRPLLPASPTCMTVITSRSRLSSLIAVEGAEPVVLDVLTPAESLEMLRRLVDARRVDAEPEAAGRIARWCSHLPLALRIVAERLIEQEYLSLADLADELADEYRRLDALASDDELADVRTVFSWSYHRLPPDAARLFRLLGLHAGADFGTAAAAALTGSHPAPVRRLLGLLTTANLLQQTATDRWRLHDLLRTYAADRAVADETGAERRHAVRRSLRWYFLSAANARRAFLPDLVLDVAAADPADEVTPLVFDDADAALRWFEAERFNLLDALDQASALGHHDVAATMPKAMAGFFEVRAYWSDYRNVYATGLRSAKEIGSAPWTVANLVGLGDAHHILGESDQALAHYREAADLAGRIGNGRAEGFAMRGIGLVQEKAGRFEVAAEHYRRALVTLRRAGARRGEGMCLLSLGDCHRAMARFGEAIDYGRQASAVFRETDDRLSVGLALNSLGLSHLGAGEYAEALACHREALSVFRRFDHPHKEALSLLNLGDVLAALGDAADARRQWSEALVLLERVGAPEVEVARARLGTS
ncbi:tetratricopeptide repeat protein [Saccharothrix sp. S26]|uniref:ATP-binding protein n=1 Tax=Saccharothrix sp. S26 TaxID=2907215 RepID=UPI001F2BEFBB|nr:tetratricopeptide repeat protein [Saccharothrix sp. S26]MCE6996983.1 tetratricopeptide repeat protein [Saccharothrix sp. S26]